MSPHNLLYDFSHSWSALASVVALGTCATRGSCTNHHIIALHTHTHTHAIARQQHAAKAAGAPLDEEGRRKARVQVAYAPQTMT